MAETNNISVKVDTMPQKAYTETEIEQLLRDYIEKFFLRKEPNAVIENNWLLIEDGVINSLGILKIVSFIEEQFAIFIETEELILENFKNINSIKSLVLAKVNALTQQRIIQESKERKLLSVVPVKPTGYKKPFFYIHGMPGYNPDANFALARYIDSNRPLYGIQAIGVDTQKVPHTCMEEMVAHYIQEIQFVQPKGPYLLGGVCVGGSIAFEVAQQLKRDGHPVSLLVMVDTPNPFLSEHDLIALANHVSPKIPNWGKELINRSYRLNHIKTPSKLWEANLKVITNYSPQLYHGQVAYFEGEEKVAEGVQFDPMQPNGWNSLVADEIELHKIPGNHFTMHYEPNVRVLAEKLSACLNQAERDLNSGNNEIDKSCSFLKKSSLKLKKIANAKQVFEIYDEAYAQEYNQRFLLNGQSRENADFEEKIISNLLEEIGEDAKWLDVACGTGYFLSRFPNIERTGLDISPAMLKVAKQANPNALFIQGDYRDKRPHWEKKWDLVSCMWWAYSYVESLSELEKVIENLANWISKRGICFLPVCDPMELGAGELKLPYISKHVGEAGGYYQFEGVIWSWIDEQAEKRHLNLLAPQLDYMLALFKKHFEQVEIIEYPLVAAAKRKAIIARSKKQKEISETSTKIEIPTTSKFFPLFLKAIRSHDWWLYKIPPLLAIAYAEILLLDLHALQSVLTVSALLFAIACVAAYGHIINDSFDIEADRQVGKSNSMAQFLPWQRALFCLISAGMGFILPILMNFGTLPTVLLGINYLLPTLYSAPPFRFKEKGILGIISDAAGAHTVPTLFIATTFYHLVASPTLQATGLAIAATAWSFCAGIRGILLHQLWDLDNDLQTDVKTLVTESGVEKVRFWMSRIIFPLELLLLGSVILIISNSASLVLVFTIFYFLLKITLSKLDLTASFDSAPVQKSYVVPHDFYEVGLPLSLATALSLQNKWFVLLLLLQAILFYPGIERRVTNLVQSLRDKPQNLQPMQAQLNASQAEVTELNSRLQQTQNHLGKVQNQLQQLQTESQLYCSQTQATPAKYQADLQQVQEQFREVQTQLQQVTEKFAQAESERQTSQAEVARLKSYLQETQGIEGVMNYYRHAIASNPDDIQLYHQALEVKPDDAQIHLQLGNALVRQNRFDNAITSYQTALQFHPDNFEIHLELGKVLEKEKKWEEAIASYRRAIKLNPDDSRSHKHLGDILAERGQINEASVCYRRALQLQPRIF